MFGLAGCKGEEVGANVSCKVTPDTTVECNVQQTKGKSAIEVCWDFHASCANGATLEAARACAVVKDGGSAKTTIPSDKITIKGSCEGQVTAEVANMKWKAK